MIMMNLSVSLTKNEGVEGKGEEEGVLMGWMIMREGEEGEGEERLDLV